MDRIDPLVAKHRLERLTDRQLQIVRLRCEGFEYQAIGKRLVIAKSTVSGEIQKAFLVLGLDGVSEIEQTKGLLENYWPLLENMEVPSGRSGGGASGRTAADDERNPPPSKHMGDAPVGGALPPGQQEPRPPGPFGRLGCLIGIVLVLGIGLGAGLLYLLLRPQPGPVPSSPQATPALAATAALPVDTALPLPTAKAADTVAPPPTETPTSQPTPAPKAYYEDGEWAPIRTGVYAGIHNTFMQEGFAMCTHPVPGFGVFIDIKNDTGDRFLLRYDASAFHAQDDLGNSYSLRGAGIGYCDDGPGPQEYQVSSNRTEYISLTFSGQVPLEAKYLVITADSLSGTKVIFHKLY